MNDYIEVFILVISAIISTIVFFSPVILVWYTGNPIYIFAFAVSWIPVRAVNALFDLLIDILKIISG